MLYHILIPSENNTYYRCNNNNIYNHINIMMTTKNKFILYDNVMKLISHCSNSKVLEKKTDK